MESEVELNDILHEMHVVATVPELYHVLVELNTIQSLLQLLTHDNTDILFFQIYILIFHINTLFLFFSFQKYFCSEGATIITSVFSLRIIVLK